MLPFFDGIALLTCVVLLFVGWRDLGFKWTALLVALLLGADWALSHLPGGGSLLMSFTAILDIVLILVVLGRDVRITG